MKQDHIFELQSSLAELLTELEFITTECLDAHDEMGIYLLDLALEECREAIWRMEGPQVRIQSQ